MKNLIQRNQEVSRRGLSDDERILAKDAFTLVELMLATAILAIIVVLMINMVSQTSKTWKSTSGKIEQFRDSRDGFQAITRRLGQATLNTYLDYDNVANPKSYMRQSELRFLSGPTTNILSSLNLTTTNPTMSVFFQAPNGFATNTGNALLQNALNTWGYFIEYGSDTNTMPSFLSPNPRYRFRLMELMEPTEKLSIYNYTSGKSGYTNIDWISNSMTQPYATRNAHVVAENVIALILLPKLAPADMVNTNYTNSYTPIGGYSNSSLAPAYIYNSSMTNQYANTLDPILNTHNQLPPVIQVTMIAVDEQSAVRFPGAYANLTSLLGSYFTNAANYSSDLSNVQSALVASNINFRVFTTDVMIKGAKWSASQTN